MKWFTGPYMHAYQKNIRGFLSNQTNQYVHSSFLGAQVTINNNFLMTGSYFYYQLSNYHIFLDNTIRFSYFIHHILIDQANNVANFSFFCWFSYISAILPILYSQLRVQNQNKEQKAINKLKKIQRFVAYVLIFNPISPY